jgi:hypothetical protein
LTHTAGGSIQRACPFPSRSRGGRGKRRKNCNGATRRGTRILRTRFAPVIFRVPVLGLCLCPILAASFERRGSPVPALDGVEPLADVRPVCPRPGAVTGVHRLALAALSAGDAAAR